MAKHFSGMSDGKRDLGWKMEQPRKEETEQEEKEEEEDNQIFLL